MIHVPCIAWLYWNPPREIWTIPWIEHPIVFYGVFFVLGFVAGYFLLNRMFKQEFLLSCKVEEQHIASWPSLIKSLQHALAHPESPIFAIVKELDKKLQQEICKLQIKQEVSNSHKAVILQAMNRSLQQSKDALSFSVLEKWMPKALIGAKETAGFLIDKLTWFVILGTIIGARLGHVLFYDWPYYKNNWISIVKVWEGGLASHGGVLGVLVGVWLYHRYIFKKFTGKDWISLIDYMVVPSGLVACCIRIGNFFNQELMGPPTSLPWGVIFGSPADGGPIVPRHPTQLYEALIYFSIFILSLYLWKKGLAQKRPGLISGLFFILVFTSRLLIDFVKTPQSLLIDESFFQMGQYLSIPFIAFGLYLMFSGKNKKILLRP
jgi:phosphatidylglycerol:prolipoprotein diacylglycerol transferase